MLVTLSSVTVNWRPDIILYNSSINPTVSITERLNIPQLAVRVKFLSLRRINSSESEIYFRLHSVPALTRHGVTCTFTPGHTSLVSVH
jgi:hypothetical protein